jgi:hypothetical protein
MARCALMHDWLLVYLFVTLLGIVLALALIWRLTRWLKS